VNRRRPEYLVVDIETIPDVSRWVRPELPHGVESPFPPTWAHRIVVIGCLWLDADYRLRRIGVIGQDREPAGAAGVDDDEVEAQLLEDFSRFVGRQHTTLLTYNGRSFDLPVIALRSLCHGVPLAWYYQERGVRYRYSEEGHIDLCDWLADHGATRSGSLDAIARLCGLPGKVGVDGSQVEGLYRAGQLGAIQSYCLADVTQTAFVFLRFRLLQGALTPEAYRAAIDALLGELERDERVGPVIAQIDRDRLRSARGFDLPRRADLEPPGQTPDPADVPGGPADVLDAEI
jgi:predicted PolB exonuclease-like 3'-5' exonuclease